MLALMLCPSTTKHLTAGGLDKMTFKDAFQPNAFYDLLPLTHLNTSLNGLGNALGALPHLLLL